ncbi:hypothetical protein [Virgibacillus senegalensis]|uniref:hypothetical protein n=1 Tax=Virgibacillus senegalensis TaxID=1499679 RepID=UPI00069E88DB|nr:hypothetical protein [Virgibacillus senegalensis]
MAGTISRYVAENETELSDTEIIDLSILQLLIEMKSGRDLWTSEKKTSGPQSLPAEMVKEVENAIEANRSQFIRLIDSLQ